MAGRHGRIELIAGTLAALLAGAALPSSAQTPVSFNPAVSFVAGALPITVGVADVNGEGSSTSSLSTPARTRSRSCWGTGPGASDPGLISRPGPCPTGLPSP